MSLKFQHQSLLLATIVEDDMVILSAGSASIVRFMFKDKGEAPRSMVELAIAEERTIVSPGLAQLRASVRELVPLRELLETMVEQGSVTMSPTLIECLIPDGVVS